MRIVLVLVPLIAVAVAAAASSASVRGVHPSRAAKYDPHKPLFQCLDGHGTVAFTAVNDDFCDCRDGSDEPGTAACANGEFYCANTHYEPRVVPSSLVNDGLCDCCDGSDETIVTCPNTCEQLAAAKAKAAEESDKVFREGYAIRQRNIAAAKKAQEEMRVSLGQKKQALALLDDSIKTAQVEKDEFERLEKEAFTQYDASRGEMLSSERCVKLEGSRASLRSTLELAQEKLEDITENPPDLEIIRTQLKDLQYEISAKLDEDDMNVPPVGGLGEPSVPYPDSEVQGTADRLTEPEPSVQKKSQGGLAGGLGASAPGEVERASTISLVLAQVLEIATALKEKLAAFMGLAVSAAQDSRNKVSNLETQQRQLETDIKQLEQDLQADYYGSDLSFYDLHDKCFNYDTPEYVYELCPFRHVIQRNRNGGQTRLGTWGAWKELPIMNRMEYLHGEKCWNGPERSTIVEVSCGTENKVLSVTEPAKCEYSMTFTTPAVCDDPSAAAASKPHHHHEPHDEL